MTKDDTILALLIQSFTGDTAAYSELLKWLERHCHLQLNVVLKSYLNFPIELRQDITQEVLIAFHQTHQTFDTSRPFLPWINAIIRYKTIDFLRRKDFKVQMSGIELSEQISDEHNKKDLIDSNELAGLINSLPVKQAKILKLSKLDGLSYGEIASELKMTESNVKVSIHRAVKLLKKLISVQNK